MEVTMRLENLPELERLYTLALGLADPKNKLHEHVMGYAKKTIAFANPDGRKWQQAIYALRTTFELSNA
jgi:hypothetical protein